MSAFSPLECKERGNEKFKCGDYEGAKSAYTEGIEMRSGDEALQSTLFANRAACAIKLVESSSSSSSNAATIQQGIRDCSASLELNVGNTKALFRRAKLQYMNSTSTSTSSSSDDSVSSIIVDLSKLLHLEPKNADGIALMRIVKSSSGKKGGVEGNTAVQTSLGALMRATSGATGASPVEDCLQCLIGLCADDVSHSLDFARHNGIAICKGLAETYLEKQEAISAATTISLLSAAANHTTLVRTYFSSSLKAIGEESRQVVTSNNLLDLSFISLLMRSKSEEVAHASTMLIIRVLKALPLENCGQGEGSKSDPVPFLSAQEAMVVLEGFDEALKNVNQESRGDLFPLLVDAIAAFVNEAGHYFSPDEEAFVDPRLETLEQRKLRMHKQRLVKKRSKMHAILAIESGIVSRLVSYLDSWHPLWRSKAASCLGHIVLAVDDDEVVKRALTSDMFISLDTADTECTSSTRSVVEQYRQRAAITSVLFVARAELGVWALQQPGGMQQITRLISVTNDDRSQDHAAEVICHAAASPDGVPLLAPLLESGIMQCLLQSSNASTRAAAASAITKLAIQAKAFKDKSVETGQILNVVLHVLRAGSDASRSLPLPPSSPLPSFSSFSSTPSVLQPMPFALDTAKEAAAVSTDRAIEVLAALVGTASIKEEIVHGSGRVGGLLSALLDADVDYQKTSAFGLAHILASLTVSNYELRAKVLADKGITQEQYEALQNMQKIKPKDGEDEKALAAEGCSDGESREEDTVELCRGRIRVLLTHKNTIPVLARLITLGSSQTKEAAARAMRQLAVDEGARGLMVQQGGLKACVGIARDEACQGNTRREAAHAIAKTLVTLNPHLLSEHVRLGAIHPLIFLCRESDASNLQQFEALLALTNIVSCGEQEQDCFCADKGVQATHYLMFSTHVMVRRAACEVFCNLPLHEQVLKVLRKEADVRLWLGLSEDFDNEENGQEAFLTARAAAGTLAVAASDSQVCDALLAQNCASTVLKLLQSGMPELTHRTLVMVTNLVTAGGDKMAQHLFEGEVVLALSAIAASCKGKVGHEAQLFDLAKEAALALANAKPC